MNYLTLFVALLLAASSCGKPKQDPIRYCQDYRFVSQICSEVCGRFWARNIDGSLNLFTTEMDCRTNTAPIFIGDENNETK